MTSLINPNNIDITYPIAGQDNDTQGFRDNFSNIKNNLAVAASEISALQSNVALALTTTSIPAHNNSTGITGQVAFDSTNLYVCVATNTWVKATLTTF
jgi:hypothetical protein